MGAKPMTDRDQVALSAQLDQLTAGLARSEPDAVHNARCTLALLARDASPTLLQFIFGWIAAGMEGTAGPQ